MFMKDCLFCKIVNGVLDSAKVWEDKNFLAILDIMPNTKGMTLVVTKRHYDSDAFAMPQKVYTGAMVAARKVARLLEKKLPVGRIALVMEGMGVNHVHIKLYPLHGVGKVFKEMWASDKVFFDKYEGYLSTLTGEKVAMKDLQKLAKRIRGK